LQITKLTPEQQALSEVTRDVLAKESSPSKVRDITESRSPFDRNLWKIAGDLGWHGIEVSAKLGGSAQSFIEASLVLRELGRTTTPGPYLSHQLALRALDSYPEHPAAATWMERLVSGEAVAAVALGVLDRRGVARPDFKADARGGGLVLNGIARDVPDVGHADLAVIAAMIDSDPVVLAADISTTPLNVTWQPTHDRTRSLFDVEASGVEINSAAVLARGRAAGALLEDLWRRAATGIALDAVGGAAKALEMTVAYTSQRVQYGRVIATFQAVKHTCADMFVESEVARIAADAATLEIAAGGQRRDFWSSVAKFRAADAYAQVAGDALQMHGGIGMTWEFDLHYWLKRAKLNQVLYGSSDAHRARVAAES